MGVTSWDLGVLRVPLIMVPDSMHIHIMYVRNTHFHIKLFRSNKNEKFIKKYPINSLESIFRSENAILHMCIQPQATFERSITFISLLNVQNLVSSSGFVNILANWSSVPIEYIVISPFPTWSLKKWCRISICFVLECWTGFVANFTALSLSHMRGTFLKMIP
jgi:hypothetical protein